MEPLENIEDICTNEKQKFCEFLACLYNCGMCEVFVDYRDDNNFCFHRRAEQFGINDLYIYFEDINYFDSVIRLYEGLTTVSIITPLDLDTNKYENDWKISVRRQFYKDKASKTAISNNYTQLNKSHISIIDSSTSDTVKCNYNMALEYDGENYAVLSDKLFCFLSTSKTEKADLIEIDWIYTEPQHRKKGYATQLLEDVSNYYLSKGLLVTYHCSKENLASANTAVKSGFVETSEEIIFERK